MMKSIAMLRYSRTKIEDHNWFRIQLCKYLSKTERLREIAKKCCLKQVS